MVKLALRRCLEEFPIDKTIRIWQFLAARSSEFGAIPDSEASMDRRMEIVKELSVFSGDAAVDLIFCLECPDSSIPDEIIEGVRLHLRYFFG